MRETWLRPNRRVLMFGTVLPAVLLAAGVLLILGWPVSGTLAYAVGGVTLGIAAVALVNLACLSLVPRLAYRDGQLLVYLQGYLPQRVPVGMVRGFSLGDAPSLLPPRGGPVASTSLLVRLSESAQAWQHRDVKPALGQWCQGHILIRGTWCEPLNEHVVQRLNQRLTEVQQVQCQRDVREAS